MLRNRWYSRAAHDLYSLSSDNEEAGNDRLHWVADMIRYETGLGATPAFFFVSFSALTF
jgi:hypothetical protein